MSSSAPTQAGIGPSDGRFAGPGDRLLRRTRAQLARRLDRIAPRRPDPRRRRRRRRSARCACTLADDPPSASSAMPLARRTCAPATSPTLDGRVGRDRVLALPRAPARARGGARARCPDPRLQAASLVIAMPNTDSLQARRSAIAGSRSTCRATSCTSRPSALIGALRRAGLRIERVSHLRGGQVGLRVARTASSARCRGGSTSMTRSAAPRRGSGRSPSGVGARPRSSRPRCCSPSPRPAPRSRPRCGAAAACTSRLAVSERAGVKVVGGDAGAERGADDRLAGRGDPSRLGRRGDRRRRRLDRRDSGDRAHAGRHGPLAPAQRRLRRQPEDLLPVRPAGRRRRGGDAASRRAVRAVADPEAGRADRCGRGRPRARVQDGRARRRPRRRDADLQDRRQPRS